MSKFIAGVALAVAACTNVSPADPETGGIVDDSQQLLPSGSTIAEACSPPEGPGHAYTTPGELEQLIVGTWVLCSGPSLSSTHYSVGMKFDPDNGFTQLIAGDGFVTVAPDNFEYGGTWSVDPMYAELSVTLASALDGVWIELPAFEDAPRRLAQSSYDSSDTWVQSIYIAID